MLEKNEKNTYFDAHFHLFFSDLSEISSINGITCAHSIKEWNYQKEYAENNLNKANIKLAFGIHPQICGFDDLDSLYQHLVELAENGKLSAIGECGFDFFTPEFKKNAEIQEKYFGMQIALAIKYQLPVIIHCRKANEKLFEYASQLKKIPAVLFHSFMGSYVEAASLLKRGINGYFSFGKQMMNNNKKVIENVKKIDINRLLFETDAPYQTLKGETETKLNEIEKIYKEGWKLRNEIDLIKYEVFVNQIESNYKNFISNAKTI